MITGTYGIKKEVQLNFSKQLLLCLCFYVCVKGRRARAAEEKQIGARVFKYVQSEIL